MMRFHASQGRRLAAGLVFSSMALFCVATHAAVLTWDGNGVTAGVTDGGGTWSTGSANWWNGSSAVVWPNSGTNDDGAIFGVGSGAAGAVTVSGAVNVNNITFNAPGSGAYTIGGTTLTLNGAAPTITANVNATISAPLAGSAGLVKAGAGVLTLSSNATYTGDTVVSAGTLTLTSTTNWTMPHNLVINGGTFNLSSSRQVNMGTTTTPRTITFGANAGTLNLDSGINFYASSAAGATWSISTTSGAPQAIISGANGINSDNDVLSFNVASGTSPTSDLKITAPIWNTAGGSLVKSGNGVLELTNSNAYNGGTTINAGTIRVSHTGGISTSGTAVTLNGGTLTLAADSAITSKNVALGGNAAIVLDRAGAGAGFNTTFGNLTSNSGSRTLTVTKGSNVTDAASLTFNGTLSMSQVATNINTFDVGAGATVFLSGSTAGGAQTISLAKQGSGKLVLNGNFGTWDAGNAIALNGGTLELRSIPGDSGNFRNITADAGAALAVVNNTGTNFFSGLTANGDISISSGRVADGVGVTHTLGTLAIGASTLTVAADASATSGTQGVTFSGATTLSGNATINVNNGPAAATLLTLAAVNGAGNNLTIGGAGNTTIGGSIGITTGSLTKNGAGTLTLNAANSFTGGTVVNQGTLIVTGNQTLNRLANGSTVTVNNGGTFQIDTTNPIPTAANSLTFNLAPGGTLLVNSGAHVHLGTLNLSGGTLTGTWGKGVYNGADVQMAGDVFVTGSSASTINLPHGMDLNTTNGGTRTFNVANVTGDAAPDLIVMGGTDAGAGGILQNGDSGAGNLIKSGVGTMLINGNATYTGSTTISAGTLQVGDGTNNTARAGTGTLAVGANTLLLNLSSAASLNNSSVTLASGGLIRNDGAGKVTITNQSGSSFNNGTVQGGSAGIVLATTLTGGFGLNIGGDVTLNASGGNFVLRGTSPGATARVTSSGAFWWIGTETAANALSLDIASGVTVSNNTGQAAGALYYNNLTGAGNFTYNGNVTGYILGTSSLGGTLTAGNRNISFGNGGATGAAGATTIVNTAGVIFNSTANNTYSGNMSGAGGVSKLAANKLTLTGNNSYTGTTTISGGRFLVNGTHTNAGAYSVNAGGTLGGIGSVTTNNANITVAAGGFLSPGSSPGTLTMNLGSGTLNLSSISAGALVFEIGAIGASDQVVLNSGTLNIGTLNFNEFNFLAVSGISLGATYKLFDSADPVSGSIGTASGLFTSGKWGGYLWLDNGNRDVMLTLDFTTVPEPSTLLLGALGAVGLIWGARRRAANKWSMLE